MYYRTNELKPCPICGRKPSILSKDMARKGHGYPGCAMTIISCLYCGISPEIIEDNIDNNEISPEPAAIIRWNKEVDRINNLIDIARGEKK